MYRPLLSVSAVFAVDDIIRPPLPLAEEIDLIASARIELAETARLRREGDYRAAARVPMPAYNQLLSQYQPALWGGVGAEQRRSSRDTDINESRANVLLAFTEAILNVAGDKPVAAALETARDRAADAFYLGGVTHVPHTTARRYFKVLKATGGDVRAGVRICQEFELSPTTYQWVAEAYGEWKSVEVLTDYSDYGNPLMHVIATDDIAELEDCLDAENALASLPEGDEHGPSVETVITRLAHGFDERNPMDDADIAEHLRREYRDAVEAGDPRAEHLPVPSLSTIRRKRMGANVAMLQRLSPDGSHPRHITAA